MRKSIKSMLGVTLLEIMLVLAIAAMIIVMSVRYYQSAQSSQQANNMVQQLLGIAAAADGLAQSTGSYSRVSAVSLGPLLPGGTATGFMTPWGATMIFASEGPTSYTITGLDMPAGVCPLVKSRLTQNNHYTGVTCDSVTYSSTGVATPPAGG